MHELLTLLLGYVRGMWRYRWYTLLIAWVVCLSGWAWIYIWPTQYRSEARVHIDTQSVLRPLLRGLAIEPDLQTTVTMMAQTLLSPHNLEKVILETDVGAPRQNVDTETILTQLRRKIVVRSDRRENLYTIRYTDPDPQTAQRVVQTLLKALMEDIVGSSQADTALAERFLDDQIQEYEVRLVAAERRLANFKKEYAGLMPGQGQTYYGSLQAAKGELLTTRIRLTSATRRRDELRQQLMGEEPVFGLVSPGGTFRSVSASSAVDAKVEEYQTQLDDLLLQYTDRHPQVVALKDIIAELKERKAIEQQTQAQVGAPAQISTEQSLELNPVYQQLRIASNEAEVEVAALEAQVADQQNRVNELEKKVDAVPEVEAKLARLNRDYNITKSRYDAFVQRRESARLAGEVEQRDDDIRFRIVDPPTVPREPAGLDRVFYLTMVLIGGVAAGMAFALLLHEIRPVFSSAQALRNVTGLPVLGVVSMKMMPKQIFRRRLELTSFALLTLALMATYRGAASLHEGGLEGVQSLITNMINNGSSVLQSLIGVG